MTNTLPTIAKYDLEDLIRRIQLATEIEFTLGEEVDPFHPMVYFKIKADRPFHPEINGRFNEERYFKYASIKSRLLAEGIDGLISEPILVKRYGKRWLKRMETQYANDVYGRVEHADWRELLSAVSRDSEVFKDTANIGYLMAIHAALMKASRVRLIEHSLAIDGYLKDTEALIRKKHMALYFHHHGWIKGMWFKFRFTLSMMRLAYRG